MTTPPSDPLQSPVWEAMVERYMADHPVVFDDTIEVGLPPVTEDQTQVPITIDARKLGKVDEVLVIGDLNPFPLTVKVRPQAAPAHFSLRMRIEQGTVIRAAVLKDGTWRVGSRYLDAAGGGCSAPPVNEAKIDWDKLGQIRAKLWRETADTLRLRMRVVHPMDTGLHKEPAFFIQAINVKDSEGKVLADVDVLEPVASNPAFTFLIADPKVGDHLAVSVRDNDGHDFKAKVPLIRTAAAPNQNAKIREGRL